MHKIKSLVPQSLKNIYHLAQAILANVIFGFPSRRINSHTKNGFLRYLIRFVSFLNHNWKNFGVGVKVIGITGSDGKTTTAQMVAKILEEAGKKTAMASTINFVIDGQEEKNLSHYTTESSFAVQKFIRKAVSTGCEYLVLETSSHALDQHRTWGVKFQTALITNVTREHLDYHKTMEKYRDAKKKLFEIVANNKGTIIVNLDMEKPEEFMDFEVKRRYAFSCHPELDSGSFVVQQLVKLNSGFRVKPGMTENKVKIVQAENIELGLNFSKFEIQNSKFTLKIPGIFNIENALGATCVGLSEGIQLETIKEALAKIKGIPGRLESIENDRGLNILVDFALTPNALEKLYRLLYNVREAKPPIGGLASNSGKIIAVFGSCGDRDRGKRPIMGQVVSEYADVVILTNEEPYHEEPQRIIDEIFAGVMGNSKTKIQRIEGVNCFRILDRRLAIRKALEIANPGDIIAITGMGNFETMVVGDKKLPWNDRKVIEEELQKLA